MKESKFEYIVKEKDTHLKIKEILKNNFNFSSRLMTKLKVNNSVFCNGKSIKMYLVPKLGDKITVRLPKEKSEFEPENIEINVVYEDDDLLIINKQPGYVVHPTKGHPNHTIANGIMKYIINTDQNFKIRFINRLDMDTSGLLIIAKNSHCQNDFSKQMSAGQVTKRYVAIVKGIISDDEGTIDLPIAKAMDDHVIRIVRDDGYPSVTHYKVLKRYEKGYTKVELLLETGRTHQIRVHMSHIGYPVVGDVLYGNTAVWLIERQALHARYLSFKHPITGKEMEVEAELPDDMIELIKKIE
ncbi:RluA family pseudouridine synthase [Anaerovorax odorimutans]|uniref:RluA family pseudouridine synthase n=1 Tax=Anaerovorax odorimutans TaxID=109327 RepID=UPI0004003939|nr:RluA family pseudouridine synthase [Anaerovorax odorimutans]